MAEIISNLAERWPAAPEWSSARIEGGGAAAKSVAGLYQMLVSGDLDAWNTAADLSGHGVGALALATGKAWQVRLARDRLLAVSEKPFAVEPGWHGDFATTRMDGALHIFEIEGKGLDGVIANAMTLDPAGKSPSAAVLFAGVNAIVYRYGADDRLRIHVDRGLAPYLWEWLGSRPGCSEVRPDVN
ncbi:hypothetical protein [Mesorhizobium sp. A556]